MMCRNSAADSLSDTFMRTLKILLSATFIIVSALSRAMETDEFNIHQFAVSHSCPVSFSIAKPKGWTVTQDSRLHSGEDMVSDGYWICTFWATNFPSTNYANITIFRSGGPTAKEAADEFAKLSSRTGIYMQKGLTSVKTSADTSGYLLECEANFDNETPPNLQGLMVTVGAMHQIKLGRVFVQDFFFHSGNRGNKGSIRVEILTREVDSSFRSELDKMVLETLTFNGA
jgi:hypothetical protein